MINATIRRVLFVCTANVLRSPVAAEMTGQFLCDNKIKVESAGMLEYQNVPLSSAVIELVRRHGINLSEHRPRRVDGDLINAADLILVFDKKQVAELIERYPQAKNRTYTVKNYAGCFDGRDMEDLWDKPIKSYEDFIKELRGYLQKCARRIESENLEAPVP